MPLVSMAHQRQVLVIKRFHKVSSKHSLADDNPQVKDRIYEAAKEARSAAQLIDHLRNLFSHQQAIESEQYDRQFQTLISQQQHMHYSNSSSSSRQQAVSENAQLFTYSNQLTLVRAAKSLVANVAKVLYLADSTVLQSDKDHEAFAVNQQLEHNQRLAQEKMTSRRVSDRLDNVANYSQLLRSFGELSSEMVDLGHCIMLSRMKAPRLQDDWEGVTSYRGGQLRFAGSDQCFRDDCSDRFLDEPQMLVSASPMHLQQHHHHYNLRHLGKQQQAEFKRLPTSSECPIDDDLSPPFGGLVPHQVRLDEDPLGLVPPEQRACNGEDVDGDWRISSSSSIGNSNGNKEYVGPHTVDATLRTQIQDMQILFQVNSASKCCLRQGDEYLSGFETRRSIVGQIRASISIIMAVVKCSIFSATTTETQSFETQVPLATHQPTVSSQFHSSATNSSTNISNNINNINNTNNRLNQFDYRHYLASACQSPVGGANFAAAAPADDLQPLANQYSQQQQQQQVLLSAEGANHHLQWHQHQQHQAQGISAIAESPLQIMNYFLQTWNNTQSAHDAINKLQLLVAPFERVANHNQLMETLGAAIKRHKRSTASSQTVASRSRTGESSNQDSANPEKQRYRYRWSASSTAEVAAEADKENFHEANNGFANSSMSSNSLSLFLMNKRQLINALNSLFLGELKSNLVERAQEFTDCAYTKHEHRETIVQLIHCIKLLLNKLVKLLYRLQRRKATAVEEQPNLGQLRQVAALLSETCAELNHELQIVVIEQSDELDKCNTQTDMIKQMKHFCLVGDLVKSERIRLLFLEQSEQLVELCKMLNQVSPTHKMKITTKSLALWFELNAPRLTDLVQCLAQNPHSRALKECAWAYIQVWCSFYDDFCQLARQVAYLTHTQSDGERQTRVANLREQLLLRRFSQQSSQSLIYGPDYTTHLSHAATGSPFAPLSEDALPNTLHHATSVQSMNMVEALSDATNADSPRSLDHYYGFGNNYHQQRRRCQPAGSLARSPLADAEVEEQLRICEVDDTCILNCQSASPRLCFDTRPVPVQSYPQVEVPTTAAARYSPPVSHQPIPLPPRPVAMNERESRVQRQSRRPLQQVQFQQDLQQQQPTATLANTTATQHQPAAIVNGADESAVEEAALANSGGAGNTDQQSSTTEADKWSDSDADAIVRGAKETAQMALSMYQFTKGEGDLNTTQDLFTQAELFAEEANELYKEVRCFSYKVPAGELKKELLAQLGAIPALVQQLQFIVKNPTVGKPATFAKVDSVIRETRSLMEAVNRVVTATLSCRQHYNMAIASMRKRTRTLSPSYRGDKGGFEFEDHTSGGRPSTIGGGRGPGGGGMGSEPDI